MRFLSLLSVCLFSCSPARSPDVALVLHRSQDTAAIEQALAGLDPARFEVRAEAELAVITTEGLCAECYRLERDGLRVTLTAGGAPGLQYGFTQWLEALGYGFFHPRHTREPAHFPTQLELAMGDFAPQIARRGLHLHTLHPIEPLFDFWVPSDAHLEGARTSDNLRLRCARAR